MAPSPSSGLRCAAAATSGNANGDANADMEITTRIAIVVILLVVAVVVVVVDGNARNQHRVQGLRTSERSPEKVLGFRVVYPWSPSWRAKIFDASIGPQCPKKAMFALEKFHEQDRCHVFSALHNSRPLELHRSKASRLWYRPPELILFDRQQCRPTGGIRTQGSF